MAERPTDPAEIAKTLKPSRRVALFAAPGSGNFSTATFNDLLALGLMDQNFYLTALGEDVREAARLAK